MANKSQLLPYAIISAGDMSQATVTSSTTNIRYQDNIAIQAVWTGTPVGTFAVNVSSDQINWVPLTVSPPLIGGGAAGSFFLELQQLGANFIQVVYTRASSSGTLNVLISGKEI